MLRLGAWMIDLERRQIVRGNRIEPLTTREATLLRCLADRPGRVVSRDQLRDAFGFHADTLSRAVDTIVHRLRGKIEVDPAHPVHIVTEYGVGYRLVAAGSSADRGDEADGAEIATLPPVQPASAPVSFAGGTVALDTGRLVRPSGRVEAVVGVELTLLKELVRCAGATLDRHQLERRVWGSAVPRSNRLRDLVYRLRTRIERDPGHPEHLLAVKGHGYHLVLPAPAPESGLVTVVAVRVDPGATERLWSSALPLAAAHRGYPAALGSGQLHVVFPARAAAEAFASALVRAIRVTGLGFATGEARRVVNPLSGRFEYLGSPVAAADARARRDLQAVLADQPAERMSAA